MKVLAELHSFLSPQGENAFPCLFQLLEAAHIPYLVAPPSIFKAATLHLSDYSVTIVSPSDQSWEEIPDFKNQYD